MTKATFGKLLECGLYELMDENKKTLLVGDSAKLAEHLLIDAREHSFKKIMQEYNVEHDDWHF